MVATEEQVVNRITPARVILLHLRMGFMWIKVLALDPRIRGPLMPRKIMLDLGGRFETHCIPLTSGNIQQELTPREVHRVAESSSVPSARSCRQSETSPSPYATSGAIPDSSPSPS